MDKETKTALRTVSRAAGETTGKFLHTRRTLPTWALLLILLVFVVTIKFPDQGSYYYKQEGTSASASRGPQQVVTDSILRAVEASAPALPGGPINGVAGNIIYIVYGRPSKGGEATWGSLQARTAEMAWPIYEQRKQQITGLVKGEIALGILSPVYDAPIGPIADIYVQKALELAPQYGGLVAPSFNDIHVAEEAIKRWEAAFTPEQLKYLAVALDIEHFPDHRVDAAAINEFTAWFAQKHAAWAGGEMLSSLVILYTMHGSEGTGRIGNLGTLTQYYLEQKTLVIPVMDAFGSAAAKCAKVGDLVARLPNTPEYPALVGIMEFRLKWGGKYDTSPVVDTFACLEGAPMFVLASQ